MPRRDGRAIPISARSRCCISRRGLDGVSSAANEAERGLLPAEPTICVGQPTALDPSRAPPGAAILWLQLPEAPRFMKGDAADEIAAPADGRWTEAMREAFRRPRRGAARRAHRGLRRDRDRAPELFARRSRGDERQSGRRRSLWRLLRARPVLPLAPVEDVNHRTRSGVYHIGASTHPGPGLGGGSGFLLASRSELMSVAWMSRARFSGQVMERGTIRRRSGDAWRDRHEPVAPYLMNRIRRAGRRSRRGFEDHDMTTTMMRALADP